MQTLTLNFGLISIDTKARWSSLLFLEPNIMCIFQKLMLALTLAAFAFHSALALPLSDDAKLPILSDCFDDFKSENGGLSGSCLSSFGELVPKFSTIDLNKCMKIEDGKLIFSNK